MTQHRQPDAGIPVRAIYADAPDQARLVGSGGAEARHGPVLMEETTGRRGEHQGPADLVAVAVEGGHDAGGVRGGVEGLVGFDPALDYLPWLVSARLEEYR